MKKRSILSIIVPFIIVSLISVLGYFTEIMKAIDYRLYDAAISVKPLATESDKFLNIVVDDETLDILDMYPLKRSTLADGMMILKELGAKTILLDTQFVNPTPNGVNSDQLDKMPQLISQTNANTFSYADQFIRALASGQLGDEDLDEIVDENLTDMEWFYDDLFDTLLDETNKISLDFDEYISNNFRFMNNIYVTNDFEQGRIIEDDFIQYLKNNHSLKNIEIIKDPFQTRDGYNPTIESIIKSSVGSGFVETHIDSDGKTRSIDLIYNKDGFYYPQLAFRAYLDSVGSPKLNVTKNYINLIGLKKEGKEPYDLKIPLNEDGSMAINWAGKNFDSTFKSKLFWVLYKHDRDIKNLYRGLADAINNPLIKSWTSTYNAVLDIYKAAEDIKANGDPEEFQDYIDYRNEFIRQVGLIYNGTPDVPSLDKQYKAMIDDAVKRGDFTDEQLDIFNRNIAIVKELFDRGRDGHKLIIKDREVLTNVIKDSIVTFGYTATSTFDIGANPFEEKFFNMAIYSTIFNNLLSEEFINILPKWVSIVAAFILIFFAQSIIRKREAGRAILLGSSLFIVIIVAYLLLFILTDIYFYILIPSLSFVLVFIQMISQKLISTSKDRAFIKSAFGQYLSEDVIKDILADPTKLELGGEKKEITAFFTDVKGFSTISEKLTPDELVHLLNDYLTAMSDIALEHKGTIDKYEGDAIIGFYGAPHPIPDHPTKAIQAAIRMKEKEAELNEFFMEEGLAPSPLHTRIGINSGPCVVGNMGTPKKMDYTMMGNDVNIAARLEGVNKQYGTWILASERTVSHAEDIFLCRRLDRVRVVGINEPIRLYNPLAMKDEASEVLTNMVECFEEGLTKFEERKWREAKIKFKEALAHIPEDKPSLRYIKMCEKFIEEPPEDNWDGVFNLTSK